jgi:hypothetical protein
MNRGVLCQVGMQKRRIPISELLADLDGLQVSLDEDDGEWSCSAETKLLGKVANVPAETIALAFEDLGDAIERRICDVMVGQLTNYMIAALMSTLVMDHKGVCDWKRFQPAPTTVSGVALAMLETLGLMVCKGDSRRFVDYGKGPLDSSYFSLTPWGMKIMGELRSSKKIERAPVQQSLAKIRKAPKSGPKRKPT